ncbi:MAG: pyridoxal-dependent decarboxylase [Acidimicrobiia bacterium]
MREYDWKSLVDTLAKASVAYLESLPTRPVQPSVAADPIRALVGGAMPMDGEDPAAMITALAADLDPFVTAHASGRYFGFVIGGLHPAAFGAEVLTALWDQNAGLHAVAPGAAVVEETAARWVVDLLGLPARASVGFVTGGQMATFTCLAAARNHVLKGSGWDVERDGLQGAPLVQVIGKTERHGTVPRALRFLGLGAGQMVEVASDDEARMSIPALRAALEAANGPTIVCVEAGNVNTGSFDRFRDVAAAVDEHRLRGNPTWVHVDGAVGLWAATVDDRLTDGIDLMDSWSTDAHKLLNVAYDSGIAICRHPDAHHASMTTRGAYLVQGTGEVRDQLDWNPEHSRRARGLGVYAVLRSLGVVGVRDLVTRSHTLAQRFATALSASGSAEIVNEVVFNQVLVRWLHPDGDGDALAERIMARVSESGVAYFSPTTWAGNRLMRISVSDWATDESDVDRAIEALLAAASQG